jgi:hypothetical protein
LWLWLWLWLQAANRGADYFGKKYQAAPRRPTRGTTNPALQFPSCPLDAAPTLRDGAHSISEETPLEKNGPRRHGAGGKASAAPPGAPPRDPRASPDHPTWWLAPLGAHHGQGGEKTAQFGPWVLPPNRIAEPKITAGHLALAPLAAGRTADCGDLVVLLFLLGACVQLAAGWVLAGARAVLGALGLGGAAPPPAPVPSAARGLGSLAERAGQASTAIKFRKFHKFASAQVRCSFLSGPAREREGEAGQRKGLSCGSWVDAGARGPGWCSPGSWPHRGRPGRITLY